MLAVIRTLKLKKPALVGHSIAGVELSSVATINPDSIAGVIYLEAAYPYAFDNGDGPTIKQLQALQGLQPPAPAESDLRTFTALQKWDGEVYGFQLPESEFRQMWDSGPDGQVLKPRAFPGSEMFMTVMKGTTKYARIPVPALAIFAIPHIRETWMNKSTDPHCPCRSRRIFRSSRRHGRKAGESVRRGRTNCARRQAERDALHLCVK